VFAVVEADGSIVQEHTLKGLDGLAAPGTVNALLAGNWSQGNNNQNHPQPRMGVLLNYSPSPILYVSEPYTNSIAAISLTSDGVVFHVGSVSRIYSAALNEPIDLAPVVMETSDANWASNTTLDVGADTTISGSVPAVHSKRSAAIGPTGTRTMSIQKGGDCQ
jgi:hypothetical protein